MTSVIELVALKSDQKELVTTFLVKAVVCMHYRGHVHTHMLVHTQALELFLLYPEFQEEAKRLFSTA